MFDSTYLALTDSVKYLDSVNQILNNEISRSTSPVSTNSVLGYVLSGIVGLIIGNLYSMFIENKIRDFLSKYLPRLIRKNKTLNGKWEQNWQVSSVSFLQQNKSEVFLKHKRNQISGTFSVTDKNGQQYTYFMTGKVIDHRYIEGEWYDQLNGHTYYGTFLLSVDVNMNSLTGYWVGTTKDNTVKSDRWIWKRL